MEISIINIITVVGVVLVSMTMHEFIHGYVAYRLGDNTPKNEGRLTINPIKHIDPFLTILLPVFLAIVGGPIFGGAKPVPFSPSQVKGGEWGVALVAVCGPLVNLLLAFISFGLMYFLTPNGFDSLAASILSMFMYVNLGFFVFNMLPIPPLDGSRLLYALAPEFIRRIMEVMERFGLIVVFLLVFFLSGLIGGAIVYIVIAFESLFAFF